jgi:hypothetical protein
MKPCLIGLAAALGAAAYLLYSYQPPGDEPVPPKVEHRPAPPKQKAIAPAQPAQEKQKADKEDKASVWMNGKLRLSQNIFAGLTRADFARIKSNAQAMNSLGYLEKWARADRRDYQRQLAHFELANRELIRQAEKKNLDGATLAYIQLTTSCVQCHQIVRDAKK